MVRPAMRKSYCLIVAVALAGCAGPPPDRSTVVGVVRYKGNPVPQGFIHFHSKDNPLVCDSGSIKKDGTYTITNAPVGPVKVVLQINGAEDPELVAKQGGKSVLILPRELGRKYARLETTPVEKVIEAGENKIEIDIQ